MNKIKTKLDEIVFYLKEIKEPVEIKMISTKFNVPINILENWFIILETNKVVKIDYSGFKEKVEYIEENKNINLLKNKKNINVLESNENILNNILKTKEIFKYKSQKRGLDINTIEKLWEKYLSYYVDDLKKEFYIKAKDRGFNDIKINSELWPKFYYQLVKY